MRLKWSLVMVFLALVDAQSRSEDTQIRVEAARAGAETTQERAKIALETSPVSLERIKVAKPHSIDFEDFHVMLDNAVEEFDISTIKILVNRSDWLLKDSTKEQRRAIATSLKNAELIDLMCEYIKKNPFNGYPKFIKLVAQDLSLLGPEISTTALFKLHTEFPRIVDSEYDSYYDLIGTVMIPLQHLEKLMQEKVFLEESNLMTTASQLALDRLEASLKPDVMSLIRDGYWRVAIAKLLAIAKTSDDLVEYLPKFVDHPLAFAQLYYLVGKMFHRMYVPKSQSIVGRVFQNALDALDLLSIPNPICQDKEGRTTMLGRETLDDLHLLGGEEKIDLAISLLSWSTKRPVDLFERPLRPADKVPLIFNQVAQRYCSRYSGMRPGILFEE